MELRGSIFVALSAVVVFVECSSNTCADITRFQSVKQKTSIIGTRFFTLHNQTLLGCAKQCLLRSACQSYSFELATGICELNAKNNATLVPPEEGNGTRSGVVISERSSISPAIAGICGDVSCPNNSKCTIFANGTWLCTVECPDPVFTNGTIIAGPEHYVGSVLTIDCDPGFLLLGTAKCQPNGTWASFSCEKKGCVNPPKVKDGELVSVSRTVWDVGAGLNYTCNGSKVQLGKAICKSDLSWTQVKCISAVGSCSDLQRCNSTYTDGEYWLVSDSIKAPVKIYCNKMNTSYPKEFLTLPEENYVDYSDVDCDPTSKDNSFSGCESTRFTKLRISEFVNLKTTNDGLKDYTFINTTNHCYYIQFGNVNDCHAHSSCNKLRTRDYVINTRGTGLKVDPNQRWDAQDLSNTLPNLFNVSKTDSGRHITVKCYQSCRWCNPKSDTYTFVIDEDLPADMDSATVPDC